METADPAVVRANNLKAMPDQVLQAIRVVNEEGGMRREGIPGLLPGLNFVIGLAGETEETFLLNEQFLAGILSEGLLVRRVNIRRLMAFPGTRAYDDNTLGRHDRHFRRFKEKVRRDFDHPMISRVFPLGTILRQVIVGGDRPDLLRAPDGILSRPRGNPAPGSGADRARCRRGRLGDAVHHRAPLPDRGEPPPSPCTCLAPGGREEESRELSLLHVPSGTEKHSGQLQGRTPWTGPSPSRPPKPP